MAADRKEPTLTSIVPDRDEIATHQQRMKTGANRPRQTAAPGAARATVNTKVVRSPLAPFAFLLALAGLGLAGFGYWQLLAAQKVILDSDSRIVELEKRLELSDDESSQSVTALQARLKEADSEISKLWGVAYDRNRKSIQTQQKSLANLEKALKSVSTDTKQALSAAKSQSGAVTSLQKQSEERQKQIANLQTELREQQLQTQAVVDLANRLEQQLRSLETDVVKRVKSNEEAIAAIDGYRRNINRELLQIREQLQQKFTAPAASVPGQP